MSIRSVAVAGGALVLALVAGLVVVLLDHGPDPDAPGYTSGQTRWVRPFAVGGDVVLDDVIGLPATTCLRWRRSITLAADVTWRGSSAQAQVELRNPRVTRVRYAGELRDGCDGPRLRDGLGPTRLRTTTTVGGVGSTTCGWTFSRQDPSTQIPAWCGEEEYASARFRQLLVPGGTETSRWSFTATGNPLRTWQGEASAAGGGDAGFEAPLCLAVRPYWDMRTVTERAVSSTGFGAPRERTCVDLWEPTPWGPETVS